MSLVLLCTKREKEKKGCKEKSCGRRVEKQLLKCEKKGKEKKNQAARGVAALLK
jgi:hypothetical protein